MLEKINNIVIVGGGTMGGDIAIAFLSGGYNVHVVSPSQKTRDSLPERISLGLKKISTPNLEIGKVAIYSNVKKIDWKYIDLVIEAIPEDLPLKQEVLLEIETLAKPNTLLASNTSNFPISKVGEHLKDKSKFLGIHFFMPAHFVPLVEIISSKNTDPKYVESVFRLMKELNKAPIRVKQDIPGFVGNRLQHAMLREALYLIDNGVVSAEDVDIAVRFGFGFRLLACGPILQKEMSGWDINYSAGTALYPHLHKEDVYPISFENMVKKGNIGMKSLKGVWEWTEKSAAEEKLHIEKILKASYEIIREDLMSKHDSLTN